MMRCQVYLYGFTISGDADIFLPPGQGGHLSLGRFISCFQGDEGEVGGLSYAGYFLSAFN